MRTIVGAAIQLSAYTGFAVGPGSTSEIIGQGTRQVLSANFEHTDTHTHTLDQLFTLSSAKIRLAQTASPKSENP